MAAYAGMIAESVISLTGRTDLKVTQAIWSMLNMVVREIQAKRDWPQDLFEAVLPPYPDFQTTREIQLPRLDMWDWYKPEWPDFRPPLMGSTIRKIEYLIVGDQPALEQIRASDALIGTCQRQGVYYKKAQNFLVINAFQPWDTLRLGIYVMPGLFTAQNNTYEEYWLFEEAYEVVFAGCAYAAYKASGDDSSTQIWWSDYQQKLAAWIASRVDSDMV
ncbi:structural protein [Pseudomonas phage PaMx35]|uniref:virion structural protein n=1 Tax=Pseudomonas phage 119X TaxID=2911431 RepID=UPI00003593C3|nr:virion structural protein [Pseudomonas phage 119X]YP_024743.1 virion structural protein [Pseudomonas phage PaP2]ANA48920.1 structural protein [Pseudomonas phage PaMx35]ANA49031.1 structural protein [Pseudomonas phage PaMx43]QBP37255.1 putative structural protein [Pseudomonas phage vB_PaeP_TF17]HCI2654937.1 hypothetical protein [Pseudomonas aeruginosa]AAS89601.1 p15 [Pseudomonas phage PaP2]